MADSKAPLFFTSSPRDPHQTLREIRQQIVKDSQTGSCLIVFDLDSTLYDLALRVTAILHCFAKSPEKQALFPEECSRLLDVEIQRGDWGLHEPLSRLGITKTQYPNFWEEVHRAWANGFFSNEFLHHDRPLPGAVQFVEDVLRIGSDVIYLTGRDVARMATGTETSLKETGFHLDGKRSRLILKPHAGMNDAQFKADVMADLQTTYRHLWLFENEPVNINAVLKRCPDVRTVFVDTCHSGLETPPDFTATIHHFEISIEEFE